MQSVINDIFSRRINIDILKCYEANDYYQKIRGQALFKLYDLNCIPSPFEFDSYVFFKGLWQEYKQYRKCFTSRLTGELILDDENIIDYAIGRAVRAGDTDFADIMTAYKNFIVSNQMIRFLFQYLKLNRVAKNRTSNMNKLSVNMRIKYDHSGLNLICDSNRVAILRKNYDRIVECLDTSGYPYMAVIDTNKIIYEKVADLIGISDEVLKEHIRNNSGIFINGVSYKTEVKIIKQILNNVIEVDNYADKVYSLTEKDGVVKTIFDYVDDKVNQIWHKNAIYGFYPIFVTNSAIYCMYYFKADVNNEYTTAIDKDQIRVLESDLSFGRYLINTQGERYSFEDQTKGYSGVYLTYLDMRELKKQGYTVSAIPIKLNVGGSSVDVYSNLDITDDSDEILVPNTLEINIDMDSIRYSEEQISADANRRFIEDREYGKHLIRYRYRCDNGFAEYYYELCRLLYSLYQGTDYKMQGQFIYDEEDLRVANKYLHEILKLRT